MKYHGEVTIFVGKTKGYVLQNDRQVDEFSIPYKGAGRHGKR